MDTTDEAFKAYEEKMRGAGMGDAAVAAFRRYYGMWLRDESGMIAEDSIDPAQDLPALNALEEADPELFSKAVVIKLNGGLGTGMGLQGPKSTLPVREGANFLDLMVKQILDLRQQSGSGVRLLLMNSFSTSEQTLSHLAKYAEHGLASAHEVELMQNQIPKINAETGEPAVSQRDPSLEWCPPGHGDLYPALLGSGWLDRLLDEGIRYAFVSNSDNLGAVMDGEILTYFAKSGAPFLLEVTRRTEADRKGGHLATRKSDRRLLLREVAQTADEDLDAFQDISRHQYFNTNSLWLRLDILKKQLEANDGVLPLPMITNRKTLDPRDKSSTPVVQLECAMGAAIECFEGAQAIEVPRSRFAPVKTTSDLFALRSDAYEVLDNGHVRLQASRKGKPPVVSLADCYKLVDSIADLKIPSLIDCECLEIKGPVEFEPGVKFSGKVVIEAADGGVKRVPKGNYADRTI